MADTWTHRIIHATGQSAYWAAQSVYSDTVLEAVDDASSYEGVTLVFSRTTPTGITDDYMMTTLHAFHRIAANTISGFTDAERATIEGYLDTMWTSLKPQNPATLTLVEYRWHHLHLDGSPVGPAVRITPKGVAATGSTTQGIPDQVSETITFRTASRRHWGRSYWPKLRYTSFDQYGRLTSSETDGLAAGFHTFINSMEAAAFPVAVASRRYGGLLTVSQLAVDSTPDVIRRRRDKHPAYTKVYTS